MLLLASSIGSAFVKRLDSWFFDMVFILLKEILCAVKSSLQERNPASIHDMGNDCDSVFAHCASYEYADGDSLKPRISSIWEKDSVRKSESLLRK